MEFGGRTAVVAAELFKNVELESTSRGLKTFWPFDGGIACGRWTIISLSISLQGRAKISTWLSGSAVDGEKRDQLHIIAVAYVA